jgi:hypothetical protein
MRACKCGAFNSETTRRRESRAPRREFMPREHRVARSLVLFFSLRPHRQPLPLVCRSAVHPKCCLHSGGEQ